VYVCVCTCVRVRVCMCLFDRVIFLAEHAMLGCGQGDDVCVYVCLCVCYICYARKQTG
jgi:hypothetical protein